ncbi:hypothetical protein GCM10023148_20520 [Actinokineospora soli]
MVITKNQMTPGYLALPMGGAVSGAGVCLKHVVRERTSAPVSDHGLLAWQRVERAERIDVTATIPSASSGRVT